MLVKKPIFVGGFSQEQREIELEKLKSKYEKKGYKFLEYKDNGTLKSMAIFQVDDSILKKEKSKQLIFLGFAFMILSVILYFSA
jgi:hypothetical protein